MYYILFVIKITENKFITFCYLHCVWTGYLAGWHKDEQTRNNYNATHCGTSKGSQAYRTAVRASQASRLARRASLTAFPSLFCTVKRQLARRLCTSCSVWFLMAIQLQAFRPGEKARRRSLVCIFKVLGCVNISGHWRP